MSKADVIQFIWNIGQLMLTVIVYGWPFGTVAQWIFAYRRFRNGDTDDRVFNAVLLAFLMTFIMCVVGGYIAWNSLPDTRIVPSVNAR